MQADFKTIAGYYDLMYAEEAACRAECKQVRALAVKYDRSGNGRLLDIACGTGAQSRIFSAWYAVTGLDLSAEMLGKARENAPNAAFCEGDMCDFALKGKFGVIVNLYGSIGFAENDERMRASLRCCRGHLAEGGVFVLTPWDTRETFQPSLVADAGERGGLSYCRMEAVRLADEHHAEVEMHHLLGRDGKITECRYTQRLCLWSEMEYRAALKAAGFRVLERLGADEFRMGAFVCGAR